MERSGPTALIDEQKVRTQIRNMVRKAEEKGVLLRPHFKTHQAALIGRWFREEGVESITVSSLSMASYFLKDAWVDQTVAFPLDVSALDVANELAEEGEFRFSISEGSPIERIDEGMSREVGIMVEVDTGDGRTGLDPDKPEAIDRIIERLDQARRLSFEGFLTHSGHSYRARGAKEIRSVHERSLELLQGLKERYAARNPIVSVGDTPTACVGERFEGVDELRPGNFVFFDLMQSRIGSCSLDDIAYCLRCPVVAKHHDRSELVVHGGAVHLSLDRLFMDSGEAYFGLPVRWEGKGWGDPYEDSWVDRLSQEHGVIKASKELFREKDVGDSIGILPVHSCLSADAMPCFQLLDGKRVDKFNG